MKMKTTLNNYPYKQKSTLLVLQSTPGLAITSSSLISRSFGMLDSCLFNQVSSRKTQLTLRVMSALKLTLNDDVTGFSRERKKLLAQLRHYRGIRLLRGLPVRGQRTKTNAKTAKRKV